MLIRQNGGARGGFSGWLSREERARLGDPERWRTVAVDGMRELGALGRRYHDLDRRIACITPIGCFGDDRAAIAAWRAMIREGAI